ncbi:nucleoside triphosphate pyrophosphatase [Chroococcus sp. FPU101]|uniref:Maf family protein n=1 Tax=Chroococcus sp. FPU101 TaxID=1974212 RepID=UPI001A8BFFD9|nr:Maf family protein [Chroococcus sp. FPU101]GFE68125.1 maf protein [Chroococcus sp. FPU101]
MSITFVLASASPARRKLLQTVGIEPVVYQSNFDESLIQKDNTKDLVQTLAHCKAQTVAHQISDALILGCDSVLELDGEIYGKPKNLEEAIQRWRKMRGNKGSLYTGHVLIDQRQQKRLICCGITQVYFADLSDAEIEAYVKSGEPLKCAGSFAIEGKGSLFVEKIEGCHSNVIGLSLPLLRNMLKDLGYQVIDFWK